MITSPIHTLFGVLYSDQQEATALLQRYNQTPTIKAIYKPDIPVSFPYHTVAKRSGLYILLYLDYPVYVGISSTNIGQRITSHSKNKIFDAFKVFALPEIHHTTENLREIEGAYISLFKPFYNASNPTKINSHLLPLEMKRKRLTAIQAIQGQSQF